MMMMCSFFSLQSSDLSISNSIKIDEQNNTIDKRKQLTRKRHRKIIAPHYRTKIEKHNNKINEINKGNVQCTTNTSHNIPRLTNGSSMNKNNHSITNSIRH